MKKFLFALALMAAGCSSDDNPTPYVPPVAGLTVPSKITVLDNSNSAVVATYTFTYDDQKRIAKMTLAGDSSRQYLFTYTADDQVDSVSMTGTDPGLVSFQYDNFLRPNNLTSGGQSFPINFDGPTETYSIGSSITFKLRDNGDLAQVQTVAMEYENDTSKKNAFHNVASSYHLFGRFGDGMLFTVGSIRPATQWIFTSTNAPYCVYNNSYGSDGYITQAIVSGGETNRTYKFEYTHI